MCSQGLIKILEQNGGLEKTENSIHSGAAFKREQRARKGQRKEKEAGKEGRKSEKSRGENREERRGRDERGKEKRRREERRGSPVKPSEEAP